MEYITKDELENELKDVGVDSSYAFNIIKKRGNGKNSIEKEKAKKIIKNFETIVTYDDTYRPKSIFDDSFFSQDELTSFIDWQLDGIKQKYAPFGLKLPFKSIEDAYTWLDKESNEGILTTARIKNTVIETTNDMEVYKSSLILMPYRLRSNNDNGVSSKVSIICNQSPFLLELNHTIFNLKIMTGMDESDILNHFLCNHPIAIKRVKGTITADTFNQYIIFQINVNDLSKDEWDELYNSYRQNTNRKHKKKLSNNNIILSRILENIEIPDEPGADFFRLLIKKWNKETGDEMKLENWRTMRSRFNTVQNYKEDTSPIRRSILKTINKTNEEV